MRRLGALAGILGSALLLAGCGYPDPGASSGPAAGVNPPSASPSAGQDSFTTGADKTPVKYPDGLQLVDVKVGDGTTVKKDDQVSVHYTGWLSNGQKFDSSRDRGQPFDVTIGQGQVIKGWDEGVPGMKVGGIRRLVIPPDLGYGAQGQPPVIPANATLVFLVEVVADKGPAPATPSPSPS